ncbi:MAG: hypothetical protein FJY55_15320 [Betaproteobacteria bacterium]|nr:hypothetical protein [Betaproteobacteria bacterium]
MGQVGIAPLEQLRAALAKTYAADGACPLTTGIFCRIAAEHAYEQFQMGAKRVAPFWRVIDPASPLARKLSCGPAFIRKQRQVEGIADPPARAGGAARAQRRRRRPYPPKP